ncbi:MAG: hypothetical protein M0R37_12515 [Bacteroidales bacterium]|nr:hypothetical protein [Bacteroidales bacterium]
MILETTLIVSTLAGFFGKPEWKFKPVQAGSELGEEERYLVLAFWPKWDPQKRLPPAAKVIRDELEAIGCDYSDLTLDSEKDGLYGTIEVHVAGLNVRDVQAVYAKHGGLGIVFFYGDGVPEISWDAFEALQEAVDDLEDTDWAWWTKAVATWTLVAVVVVGAIFLAVVLWKRSKAP